jgi:hypothetical protein
MAFLLTVEQRFIRSWYDLKGLAYDEERAHADEDDAHAVLFLLAAAVGLGAGGTTQLGVAVAQGSEKQIDKFKKTASCIKTSPAFNV